MTRAPQKAFFHPFFCFKNKTIQTNKQRVRGTVMMPPLSKKWLFNLFMTNTLHTHTICLKSTMINTVNKVKREQLAFTQFEARVHVSKSWMQPRHSLECGTKERKTTTDFFPPPDQAQETASHVVRSVSCSSASGVIEHWSHIDTPVKYFHASQGRCCTIKFTTRVKAGNTHKGTDTLWDQNSIVAIGEGAPPPPPTLPPPPLVR